MIDVFGDVEFEEEAREEQSQSSSSRGGDRSADCDGDKM